MTDEKIELLAKFFTKFRSIKDQSLDELFELDDYWNEIYGENRIKLDFDEAQFTFYISMSGNNARNLISYIYKDATIFLERKYDRYIKHIERINKNVKWRSDKTIYKI